MPMYDFQCHACGADHELLMASDDAKAMVLVCTGCGGEMGLVLSRVTIMRSRSTRREPAARAKTRASCGHNYACRCSSVKLTKPNPFRRQIEAELKPPQQW